jgi:hypothetical protein
MTFFCETADGNEYHSQCTTAEAAAEDAAEVWAGGGDVSGNDIIQVRVTEWEGCRSVYRYFEVSIELTPTATAEESEEAFQGFDS